MPIKRFRLVTRAEVHPVHTAVAGILYKLDGYPDQFKPVDEEGTHLWVEFDVPVGEYIISSQAQDADGNLLGHASLSTFIQEPTEVVLQVPDILVPE